MGDSRRDFRERMLELRARQNSRATSQSLISAIGVDEIRAIKKLAMATWGRRANLFLEPGVVHVGFFLSDDDAHLPPQQRAQEVVARGRTYREVSEQIGLWRMRL